MGGLSVLGDYTWFDERKCCIYSLNLLTFQKCQSFSAMPESDVTINTREEENNELHNGDEITSAAENTG